MTLYLGSIEVDRVINESCNDRTAIQRNYRKMTIKWSVSCYSFVKFRDEKFGSHTWLWYIQLCVIKRFVLKGLHCAFCYFAVVYDLWLLDGGICFVSHH